MPPSIGPFIPSPKDQFGELGPAVKKATFVVGAVFAALALERKFPKSAGPLTQFLTGLETIPGKGIKIKPAFFVWAGPQPIGVTPPSMTGLADITGDPLGMLDLAKVKASYDRLHQEKHERDFVLIHNAIMAAQPKLQAMRIGLVTGNLRAARTELLELGPDTEKIFLVAGPNSAVDRRLFLRMEIAALEGEIERRRPGAGWERLVIEDAPKRDGGAIGIFDADQPPNIFDPILLSLWALQNFLAANPADP